jgi:uncharacterized membrane protein
VALVARTLLVLPIAAYGLRYAIQGEAAYTPEMATSFRQRSDGVFLHTLAGSIVLLLGVLQFHSGLRRARPAVHRLIGKIYVVGAMLSGGAGLYLSRYSYGGWMTHFGFGALGLGLLVATAQAYRFARRREFPSHRRWMIRSYALFFGAVTLRIWMPVLVTAFQGDFLPAYRIVAWLAWVPNLVWAEWYVRRPRSRAAERELAATAA